MNKGMQRFGMIVVAVLVFSMAGYSLYKNFAPSAPVVFRAVSAPVDSGQLPVGMVSTINDRGSFLSDSTGHIYVGFWTGSQTIDVNGFDVGKYDCSNGGTVYIKAGGLYIYYNCATGDIAVSKIAYATRDVLPVPDELLVDLESQQHMIGDVPIITANGWQLKVNADGTLTVISPLGEELKLSVIKGAMVRDGDAYLKVSGPANGWQLTLDEAQVVGIVVMYTPDGWAYVASK